MFAFGGLNVVVFSNVKTLELSVTAAAGTACARNTTFAKRPTLNARMTTAIRCRRRPYTSNASGRASRQWRARCTRCSWPSPLPPAGAERQRGSEEQETRDALRHDRRHRELRRLRDAVIRERAVAVSPRHDVELEAVAGRERHGARGERSRREQS